MSVLEKPIIFTVGSAPHWRSKSSIAGINWMILAALLPTALAGAYGHAFDLPSGAAIRSVGSIDSLVSSLAGELGIDVSALWLVGIMGTLTLALGLAVLFEYAIQLVMRQPYRVLDGHAALMGALMGLMMPPSVPLWVLAVGIFLTIFLGKQIFGGIGGYPMHPVMVGWLILLLSWPKHVYPLGTAGIATSSSLAIWASLAGGLFLWFKGIIRPQVPIAMLVAVLVFSWFFAGRLDSGPMEQVFSGNVVLAAFFIATDSTCSPANRRALWLYGAIGGFLIVLIRAYGVWPDAVPFAVLLINILNPLLDRIKPRIKEVGRHA